MSTNTTFKPCPTPWCDHSEPPYVWQGQDDLYQVICAVCQVEGPKDADEAGAIDEWNNLSKPESLTQILREMRESLIAVREANGILEDALQEAANDYPGSKMQGWCVQQIKLAHAKIGDK